MLRAKIGKHIPMLALALVVAAIIFAAGALSGRRSYPATSDWMSFAGALIGASVTVAGSIYVLDRERRRETREQEALILALLTEVEEACTPFQVANQSALQGRYGKTAGEQVQELRAAVHRVWEAAKRVEPRSVREMKALDAIAELSLPEGELDHQASMAEAYPNDADFGGLNAIAHGVQAWAAKIQRILKD